MMLAILQFIFSSFWVWSGTIVILYVIGDMIVTGIAEVRGDAP